jgi:activator of HSP90 ATPase
MISNSSRRDFSLRLASVFSAWGIAGTDLGFSGSADQRRVAADERISRTSESIHQENVFSANRKQVYEALMDAKQFTKVTAFSSVPKAPPAEISSDIGGAFSCFGGHIVGRHVELVPDERIVQAWRVVDWDAGIYSIAKFELKEQGSQTRLVFDHIGFPKGKAEHLAAGWKTNYWEPLQKYFAAM